MNKVLFSRLNNRRTPRGYAVNFPYPMDMSCSIEPFIVVQIDMAEIDMQSISKPETIRLKMDKLMKQYPPTSETYEDENGETQTRITAGYFDLDGVSRHDNPPVITVDDLVWDGKDE